MLTRKETIKQKIVATFVVVFMIAMVAGSISVPYSGAVGNNMTLIQNLVAGSLSMEAPTSIAFNNITLGVATNSLANLTQVNARDYRGTGVNWSVTGSMNALTTAGVGVNNISNTSIAWKPGAFVSDNGTSTGVALGSGGYFGSLQTLFNTSVNNGMGNYRILNTELNVVYSGSAAYVAGTYQNTLTLTIQ